MIVLSILIIGIFQFNAQQFTQTNNDQWINKSHLRLRLTYNEQHQLISNAFLLPIDNLEDLNKSRNFTSNIPLISEYLKFSTNKSLLNIFTFVSDNQDFIDVCAMDSISFFCDYRVMNYVINQGIIVQKIDAPSVSLNQRKCETLHKIRDGIFILQCSKIEGQVIFNMIDFQGTIFDKVELSLDIRCNPVSLVLFESLILYETHCFSTHIQIVSINLNNLSFSLEIKQFTINSSIFNLTDQSQGILREIIFCSLNIVQLNYENNLINFMLMEQQFKIVNHLGSLLFINQCKRGTETIDEEVFREYSDYLNFNTDQEKKIKNNIFQHGLLILLVDQKISAAKSQFYNQTLQQDTIQIRQLDILPFFVSLSSNSDIVFYKFNQQGHYLSFMNSKYIAIFPADNFQLFPQQPLIYETELYDITNPRIILSSKQINICNQQNSGLSILDFKSLSLGAPIDIELFKDDSGIIKEIEQFQTISCYDNKDQLSSMNSQLIVLSNNEFGLLYYNSKDQIFIRNCQTGKIINLPTIFSEGAEAIFVSASSQNFAIQTNTSMRLMRVTENFEVQLNITVALNSTIQMISQQKNQLLMFFQIVLQLFQICLTFNCLFQILQTLRKKSKRTLTKTFEGDYHLINQTTIIFKSFPQYQKRMTLPYIVYIHIYRYKLLVVQLSNSYIEVKLYNELLELVYELPTYNYKLIYPAQFKVYKNYLLVVGIDNCRNEALLIYNINNLACNSLQDIISIDKGAYNFNFFDGNLNLKNSIYYIFNNSIRIYNLKQITFHYSSNRQEDSFSCVYSVFLNLTSKISNHSEEIEILITYFNHNYDLRFHNNIDSNQIIFHNEKILNLDYIYGSIFSIIAGNNNSVYCFSESNLIYDYCGEKQIFKFENPIENNQQIENLNDGELNIYYLDQEFLSLQVIKYSIKQQKIISINKVLDVEGGAELRNIQGNILSLTSQNVNRLAYFHMQVYQVSPILIDQTGVFNSQVIDLDNLEFIVISLEKSANQIISKKLLDPYKSIANNIFSLNISINESFHDFRILNSTMQDETIIIELILLHKTKTFGYIYKVSIDHEAKKILDYSVGSFIRFGDKKIFTKLLIVKNEFMFVQITNQTSQQEQLFYNILSSQKQEIIDPIYQYQGHIDSIEKYNSTHFIQVTIDQFGQQQHTLFSIDNYYHLICEPICENQYQLLLQNEVSNLTIIVFKAQESKSINNMFLLLLSMSFLLINIQLNLKKKMIVLRLNQVSN